MHDLAQEIPLLTFLLGFIVVLSILLKWALGRVGLPAAIGWLGLGFALRLVDGQWHWLTPGRHEVFSFLGTLGVACLLFRVGMQCHIQSLLTQLGRAVRIWIADFLLSGLSGFGVSYFLLGLSIPTSLIVGTALTATSVGVAVIAWEERKCLSTPNGQLMLDVAEIDDITGVIAMAMLFSILPVMQTGTNGELLAIVASSIGWFLLKMIVFGFVCYVFSHYLEGRLTDAYQKIYPPADPLALILATSLLIASVAEFLGLSIAVGAFFAGIMFSHDSAHSRIENSIAPLAAFITPFFFISIGLDIALSGSHEVLFAGILLSLAAIFGKVAGKFLPGMKIPDRSTAMLLGFSMIPRAEIAMIIIQKGKQLGSWAMPDHVFGAMVIVMVASCVLSPLIVQMMLKRLNRQQLTADN